MTSQIIQLHASPEELAAFAANVATDLHLNMALLKFRPTFSCERIIDPAKLVDSMDLKAGQEVILLSREVDLSATNQLKFYDLNPNFISFHFGTWLPRGLCESSMGYKSEDEPTIAIGKEISKRLKKITKTGVHVINPKTGESSFAKTFRYTQGALALEKEGIQMLPLGGNLVRLGDAEL